MTQQKILSNKQAEAIFSNAEQILEVNKVGKNRIWIILYINICIYYAQSFLADLESLYARSPIIEDIGNALFPYVSASKIIPDFLNVPIFLMTVRTICSLHSLHSQQCQGLKSTIGNERDANGAHLSPWHLQTGRTKTYGFG